MSFDQSGASPQSGNYIAANGRVYNMVDLLGGGTPINDTVYDINQYAPKCGLVLGSDGRVYDLTELLRNAAQKPVGAPAVETAAVAAANTLAPETALEAALHKRRALLRDSDHALALDRLGLTVPQGSTFKAWEPFLAALGSALNGAVATYRQALVDLPKLPNWPGLQPEDWPQAPEGVDAL